MWRYQWFKCRRRRHREMMLMSRYLATGRSWQTASVLIPAFSSTPILKPYFYLVNNKKINFFLELLCNCKLLVLYIFIIKTGGFLFFFKIKIICITRDSTSAVFVNQFMCVRTFFLGQGWGDNKVLASPPRIKKKK